MNRRQMLLGIGAGGLVSGLAMRSAQAGQKIMPWEWVDKQGEVANTDGTPLQFMPKKPKDANPLENELEKYSDCPYCGMGRGHEKWRKTRHLVHYADDLVDGTCSLHCAAVGLSLNLDRGPKAIYGADAGSDAAMPPLVKVEQLHYVIDPSKMGTMTMRSKWAYADAAKAKTAAGDKGEPVGFDDALLAAYVDMAADTVAIRKRRADKRAKGAMMKK